VTIRTHVNRVLAPGIIAALTRLPSLERLVARHVDARRLHIALTRLGRRGVRIQTVYDIGAHDGQWSEDLRRTLPKARFVLFEANEAHASALARSGERYFIALLSSDARPVDFYGTGGAGDSYYREATRNYDAVEPRRVLATTLDRMVESNDLPYPDLIKADVQGAELDVLRGGTRALEAATLVLLECPIVEYNLGAPRIDEYFEFMDEHGFSPIDSVSGHWQQGHLVEVDVLFADVRSHPELVP
jgi:FkbM family methyltransferase